MELQKQAKHRENYGAFSPVSQFIFHKPFRLQQPQALCGACSLTVVFSPFFFLFPHKQEEESLPQKQRVLHSNRLGARGKYPHGRFSDGETREGAEGEGVGDKVRPAPLPPPRASCLNFSLRLSPVPHDSCIHTQAAPCQGHTEGRGQTEARKMARGPVWSVLQWEKDSWGVENRIQRSVF